MLHRAAGGWRFVGSVPLDSDDLAAGLAELRRRAQAIAPGGVTTKLIIPNDQIRYMSVETGEIDDDLRRQAVRRKLDGATPYAVDELAFDISVDGPMTHVAAVARETLEEAEAFATQHRLNPVSFVAKPGIEPFLGEPFFGVAEAAGELQVERDGIVVIITGDAVLPQMEDEAEDDAPAAAPGDQGQPLAGMRHPSLIGTDRPADAPIPEAEPEAPANHAPQATAPEPVADIAPMDTAVETVGSSADTTTDNLAEDAPEEPAFTGSPDTPDTEMVPAEERPSEAAPAQPPSPPEAVAAASQDRAEPEDPAQADPAQAEATPAAPTIGFTSRRGKGADLTGSAPDLSGASRITPTTAAKPVAPPTQDPTQDRPLAAPVVADLRAPEAPRATPAKTDDASAAPVPEAPQIAPPSQARPIAPPPKGRGGFGRSAVKPAASAEDTPDTATTGLQGALGGALGSALTRRKQRKATAKTPVDTASQAPGQTPGQTPAQAPAKTRAKPAAEPIAPPPPRDEAEQMTIFGARKPQQVRGKPRYLGLMMTAALLVVLAVIGAWGLLSPGEAPTPVAETGPADNVPADSGPADTPVTRIAESGTESDAAAAPAAPQQPPQLSTQSPQQPAESAAEETTALAGLAPRETADTTPGIAQPQAPELTDTDTAVLEALRDATTPDTAPENAEDTVAALQPETDLATDTTPELDAAELEPEPEPEAPPIDLANADDETFYAATGIWPSAPEEPETPSVIGLSDLYVASIDRSDLSQDAIALPTVAALQTDTGLNAVASPAAAGTAFKLDPRGLVTATAEGTLSPDGVLVRLGRPPVVPPALPDRLSAAVATQAETDATQARLAAFRPKARPTDLIEQAERAQLGGRSRDELSRIRPRLRPEGLKPAAAPETETAPTPAPEDEAAADFSTATAQAVAVALVPKARPRNFAAKVVRNSEPAKVSAPQTVTPRIPSSASVARQATLDNAINLNHLNLIGVYGNAANRRALVRLPSGRYKKVKVGDNIDGGKVIAIGDSELRYSKGSRSHTLKIPNG